MPPVLPDHTSTGSTTTGTALVASSTVSTARYVVQDDLDFRQMLISQRAAGRLGKVWGRELRRGGLKVTAVAAVGR